jgi:hypothetical protein
MADYDFVPGDYNVICDRCGFKVRASQTRMTWDNLRVCDRDWEPRHPQDFKRGKVDKQHISNPRPEPTDVFLTDNEVTASSL